ncbi:MULTISPECIES: molybdopterin oxidoreductase family protein [Synechococcales]|uniref:molybdopterin oxidoreductase family protein n=1 Tax=Synechococcus sp. CS-1333 TaxID=2848638 RepID=UPI0037DA1231
MSAPTEPLAVAVVFEPSSVLSSARAQCPYCGVGCGLELKPAAAALDATDYSADSWTVRGDRLHPSSLGQVCVKGATVAETLDRNRLSTPLWREQRDQPFEAISWERAFTILVERIQVIQAERGSGAIAMYGSGQFLTEDYYVANKLIKGALGTNNFDANSRLCMSSAVSGYKLSLGSDGPPCCYDDLDLAGTVLLIGTNTADCHPVLFQRLLKRKRHQKEALQIIVVDPRATATSAAADLHLAIRPGTDLVLLHGVGHLLLQLGAVDPERVAACADGFAELAALWAGWTPERVCALCGIEEEALRRLASLWAASSGVLSLWSMGVNQSVEGTATVAGIINLHLVTGQIGKPGAGPFSLTGQPNAMGGREAGGLAALLPGYRSIHEASHRAAIEQHWGFPPGAISARDGLSVWEQIEAMERGELGLWWVAATNPLVSLPSLDRVRQAVAQCPLVVLSEAYAGTETEAVAHLVLPAAQWSEKEGVMTNSERRVTLSHAFRQAPGEARPDWAIFAELGRRLGFSKQFAYGSAAEVYAEFASITAGRLCDHSGLSHALLAEHGPQQWPFPAGTAAGGGQPRLHTEGVYPTANGKARLLAQQPLGLAEPPDDGFPLVLTVGRYLGHWHTMTRTVHVERVCRSHPEPLLEIHPADASCCNLEEGALARVSSRRGELTVKVQITDRIRPGTVFLPMHWGAAQEQVCEANRLMHALGCPISKQPELKAAAVRVERAEIAG